MVSAVEDSTEDLEQELDVALGAWSVDDGEGAGLEGGGDLARVVAVRAATLHHDGGGRVGLACQEVEQARAGLLRGVAGIEREPEVDDRDVDRVRGDDLRRFAARGGPEGEDADGFKQAGQVARPVFGLPPGVGKEKVESAWAWGRGGDGRGTRLMPGCYGRVGRGN